MCRRKTTWGKVELDMCRNIALFLPKEHYYYISSLKSNKKRKFSLGQVSLQEEGMYGGLSTILLLVNMEDTNHIRSSQADVTGQENTTRDKK